MHYISDRTIHRRDARRWMVLAVLSIGCAPGGDAPGSQFTDGPAPQLDHRPGHDVPRLAWDSLIVDDTDATDFAMLHDTLVVLDRRAGRLVLLARQEDGWDRVRQFGASGDGPGRLRRPVAVAAHVSGTIDVLEADGRLQRFDRDGRVIGERRLRYPCLPFQISMARTDDDQVVVGGLCNGGGNLRDTVFAMAWMERPDSTLQEVARVPVATLDLEWGAIPSTARYVVPSVGNVVFASGLDGCSVTVRSGVGLPTGPGDNGRVHRQCRPLPARYRGTRPASWDDLKLPNGTVFRWPDPFQAFAASNWTPVPLLFQMISDDSLVSSRMQDSTAAPAPPQHAVLVSPTSGFKGCADGRCLWFDPTRARMALLDASAFPLAGGSAVVRR